MKVATTRSPISQPVSDPSRSPTRSRPSAGSTARRAVADYVIAIADATRGHDGVSRSARARARRLALLHAAQAHARARRAGDFVSRRREARSRRRCSRTGSCCATRYRPCREAAGVRRRARRRGPAPPVIGRRPRAPHQGRASSSALIVAAPLRHRPLHRRGLGHRDPLRARRGAPGRRRLARRGPRARSHDGTRPARRHGRAAAPIVLTLRHRAGMGVRVRPARPARRDRPGPAAPGARSALDPRRRGVLDPSRGRGCAAAAPLGPRRVAPPRPVPLARPLEVAPRRATAVPLPPPAAAPTGEATARHRRSAATEVPAACASTSTVDPIRLVHWPATARTGTVMVRELEGPQRPRLVVVVDLRGGRDRSGGSRLERAGLAIARHSTRASWDARHGRRPAAPARCGRRAARGRPPPRARVRRAPPAVPSAGQEVRIVAGSSGDGRPVATAAPR